MNKEHIRALRRKQGIRPFYPQRDRKKAVLEAEKAEDDDFMPVEEVPEECATCKNEDELRQFIRNVPCSRPLLWLIIHCTATGLYATVTAILNYWRNVLGWINPGYNILFLADGSFTVVADFDTITNGVKGFNANALNFSWIGGIDDKGKPIDNMTPDQYRMMSIAIEEVHKRWPDLKVKTKGHRDFPNVKKACPCFDTILKFKLKK